MHVCVRARLASMGGVVNSAWCGGCDGDVEGAAEHLRANLTHSSNENENEIISKTETTPKAYRDCDPHPPVDVLHHFALTTHGCLCVWWVCVCVSVEKETKLSTSTHRKRWGL